MPWNWNCLWQCLKVLASVLFFSSEDWTPGVPQEWTHQLLLERALSWKQFKNYLIFYWWPGTSENYGEKSYVMFKKILPKFFKKISYKDSEEDQSINYRNFRLPYRSEARAKGSPKIMRKTTFGKSVTSLSNHI